MSNDARYGLVAEDRGQAAFRTFNKGLKGIGGGVTSLMPQLAAVAGIAGFGAMIKGSLDAADKIHKLAIRTGVSTEALSQLEHAANLSGVSFESTAKGLEKMSRSMSEAAAGFGTGKRALEQLGLDAKALKQLKPERQFEVMADAIAGLTNESDQTRIAMEIFGRAGGELLPMLKAGSAGIQDMRAEADRLGKTLSQDQANAAADAQDAIARLDAATKGLWQSLAVSLGPAIADIANWLSEKIPKAVQWTVDAFAKMDEAIGNVLENSESFNKAADAPNVMLGPLRALRFLFTDAGKAAREAADGVGEQDKKIRVAVGGVEQWRLSTEKNTGAQRNLAEALVKETIPAVDALRAKIDEISLAVSAIPIEAVTPRMARMSDDAVAAIGALQGGFDSLSSSFGGWFSTVATEGSSAAGKFKAVWMSAIQSVIAALAEFYAKKAVFAGLSLLPGIGPIIGAIGNAPIGSGPATGAVDNALGRSVSGPQQIVFVNQSLTPASAADKLDSYRRVNDLQVQASPYLFAG